MKSVKDDLEARSTFRLAVKQLIDAEAARRIADFRAGVGGEDAFLEDGIRSAILVEVANVRYAPVGVKNSE